MAHLGRPHRRDSEEDIAFEVAPYDFTPIAVGGRGMGKLEQQRIDFRNALAASIAEELQGLVNNKNKNVQVRTWVRFDRQGPMGGFSGQVTAAVDIDGTVYPVAINVYCDDNIARHIEAMVEQDRENDRLREMLGFTGPNNLPTGETEES